MASRKLYREIAESIRTNMIGMAPMQAKGAAYIARAVASDLKRDNHSFRYDRFYEAAGLDYNGYPIKDADADAVAPCICHQGCMWPVSELTDDGHCPQYQEGVTA